ncbi:MAG TPA: aromatic hydrocarbon degradation protein [Flavisolibacter sp.]|jgi:hypothetical protein|nr:aromatic hydrocarbon degradation protein [Flavisolibacter sp.]
MKKILLAGCLLTAGWAQAQEPADALRFSFTTPGGSARVQAIGGAMGSLGGDVTATFVNPAGLAFYKTGDFIITPRYSLGRTNATYLSREEKEKRNQFTWGTTGFVIGTGGTNNVKSAAFSIAYNRAADFNNTILYRGVNNQSSYSQKFLEEIRGIKDANQVAGNYPYGSSLAFNTYWIDTVAGGSSNNFQFQSRAANLLSSGLIQQNTITTKGGIDEFALGLAVNLRNKLFIGGTIGIPVLHFEKETEFIEADATENTGNRFNYGMLKDNLTTKGVGFNIKAGLIFKPQEYWRLGFAVHSPTFYNLTDNYSATVTTDTEGYQGVQTQTSEYVAGAPSSFKYSLTTPYKLIGSISYVIREIQDVTRQRGFITADVEYINHRASSFSTDAENGNNDQATKDYLKSLNTAIDNAYKGSFNFRLGGELKFTTFMVRLGGAYYSNPYQNIHGEKGSKLNLSGGLGYRNKGFFIDLTYVHAINKDVDYAYRLENGPYYAANIKQVNGNILATMGVKF